MKEEERRKKKKKKKNQINIWYKNITLPLHCMEKVKYNEIVLCVGVKNVLLSMKGYKDN